MAQASGGNREALDALIVHYHPRLLKYVKSIFPRSLATWLEPNDILQETYVTVNRSIAAFQPQGEDAFFRWAATIARSRMLDQIKAVRAFKRRGELTDAQDRRISDTIDVHLQYNRTPSESAAGHELFAAVAQSIQMLPEEYRKILMLRHDQKLSPPEAAAKMNRSTGAAQTLYWRAIKALREKLQSTSFIQ